MDIARPHPGFSEPQMSEITAIYENGVLRPLTPLQLNEGQQVRLQVLPALPSQDESYAHLLEPLIKAGLLTLPPRLDDVPVVSNEQLREFTQSPKLNSEKLLSETIIEDRGEF